MLEMGPTLSTHRAIAGRFAEHLTYAPDGSDRIPHLDWNVSDLGAHVLSGVRAYTRAAHEDVPMWPDARDGDGGNRTLIDATPEREPAEVAAAIPAAVDELHSALAACTTATLPAWGHIRGPARCAHR